MRPLTPGLQLRAYQLKHRIGRGGEGDVWAAQHMSGRMVALKARPHTDDRDSMRFRAEFERLRTLRLPGVVRVLDTGADQGYLFFTMEIAEGAPFDQFMGGLRSPNERVRYASEAGRCGTINCRVLICGPSSPALSSPRSSAAAL